MPYARFLRIRVHFVETFFAIYVYNGIKSQEQRIRFNFQSTQTHMCVCIANEQDTQICWPFSPRRFHKNEKTKSNRATTKK